MKKPSAAPRQALIVAGIFLSIFLILALIHLFFGRMTGDEGWYCLSARSVMEGKVPYKDFLFTQMPLIPYIYSIVFWVFGPSMEAARGFSLFFSTVALCFAMWTCYRRAGFHGLFVCGAILALNFSFIFDAVSFRTQPFTLALTSILIFLISEIDRNKGGWVKMLIAILLVNIGFLTRLSLLPALVFTWAYALWMFGRKWPLIVFLGLVDILLIAVVLLRFDLLGNMWFGIYDSYHEYYGDPTWSLERLIYHFGKGWLGNQWLVVFCLIWGMALTVRQAFLKWRNIFGEGFPIFELYLVATYFGILAIHVINVQSHPTHQSTLFIYAAVLGATAIGKFLSEQPSAGVRRAAMASLVMLALLNGPSQEWNIHFNGDGSLGRVAEARKIILDRAKPDDELLCFNAELAVNTGLKLLPGYDMSEFSYYPNMSDERAKKLHVTNLKKLIEDISTGEAKILCVGNYEFSIMSGNNPELGAKIKEVIDANYTQVAKVDNYGQFFSTLYIFVRKGSL